jgi:PAS domain-containing protein
MYLEVIPLCMQMAIGKGSAMNANRASRKPRVPLALSKGYYQSAFQHADEALAMLDLELPTLDANDRCCQLLAQPKEAIIGIRLDTLFSSDTDVFIPQLRQAIEQNTEAHFAASAGARIFLSKPYTAGKLLRAIAAVLGTN